MEGIKRNGNIIIIDLSKVTTQTERARLLGLHESTVRQRIVRAKKGKGPDVEKYFNIPELDITLVPKP